MEGYEAIPLSDAAYDELMGLVEKAKTGPIARQKGGVTPGGCTLVVVVESPRSDDLEQLWWGMRNYRLVPRQKLPDGGFDHARRARDLLLLHRRLVQQYLGWAPGTRPDSDTPSSAVCSLTKSGRIPRRGTQYTPQ